MVNLSSVSGDLPLQLQTPLFSINYFRRKLRDKETYSYCTAHGRCGSGALMSCIHYITTRLSKYTYWTPFRWVADWQRFCRIRTAGLFVSQPCDAHCCHMGTAIKHPAPHRVKPSFVICDIRALLTLRAQRAECPDVKNYKWRLNPVWHGILYSCTYMATVGVKGLKCVADSVTS